jgi:hypothetical protein
LADSHTVRLVLGCVKCHPQKRRSRDGKPEVVSSFDNEASPALAPAVHRMERAFSPLGTSARVILGRVPQSGMRPRRWRSRRRRNPRTTSEGTGSPGGWRVGWPGSLGADAARGSGAFSRWEDGRQRRPKQIIQSLLTGVLPKTKTREILPPEAGESFTFQCAAAHRAVLRISGSSHEPPIPGGEFAVCITRRLTG